MSPYKAISLVPELLHTLNAPLDTADKGSEDRTYTLNAVLPRDPYNCGHYGRYGRYGVATILRKDFSRKWVARVREVDWDLEGRVSVVEMRAAPEVQDGD